MNRKIDGLFHPDGVNDLDVAVNQLREGLQELILSALSRNGFPDKAVFHGGTCLRILYALDRFSEDLDFSLNVRDYTIQPHPYVNELCTE